MNKVRLTWVWNVLWTTQFQDQVRNDRTRKRKAREDGREQEVEEARSWMTGIEAVTKAGSTAFPEDKSFENLEVKHISYS